MLGKEVRKIWEGEGEKKKEKEILHSSDRTILKPAPLSISVSFQIPSNITNVDDRYAQVPVTILAQEKEEK